MRVEGLGEGTIVLLELVIEVNIMSEIAPKRTAAKDIAVYLFFCSHDFLLLSCGSCASSTSSICIPLLVIFEVVSLDRFTVFNVLSKIIQMHTMFFPLNENFKIVSLICSKVYFCRAV